ncbi:uncharacterized protein A1O9_05847 [Exophiala aquamarina CBS 119918]|uniref:Uncharacterized protein n=1 Tax=Exophiala aquamarina CBS 119918 TaxID=1182545 RepID=A0A072PQY2_9EURO|nr:uncharacterized protein A1O9_05847 [Exophiala aquamarina CBS 119918]KEF57925.1 hypothetical protein A1O9_05847 [Exophiala aquamarina CBS 119918]
MDLFLSVGSRNVNMTRKNTQTRNSEHSRSLVISNAKPSGPTAQIASDKAPAAAKIATSVQPSLTPPGSRRVTLLGSDARQMNSTDQLAQECAPTRMTSPASAVESKSWKTFQSRQLRPSYPPTSWRCCEDDSDDEHNTGGNLGSEHKQTSSKATHPNHLNTNHEKHPTEILPGGLTKSIASHEDRGKCSLSTTDSFSSPAYPALGPEDNLLPGQTADITSRVSKISLDPPRPSPHISEAPVCGKATEATPRATSNTREAKASLLPDPETAYGQKFYYTACPHASPPSSRPLNVQPTLATYQEGLLRYAPYHLRVRPREQAPEIYILEGACSQCDLAARREAELRVLNKYKSKVDVLSIRLYELQGDVDLDSPTLPREYYPGTSQALAPPNAETNNTGLVFTPEVIEQILSLEADLDSLIKRRDREIKFVWRGYTARWGPATLGVFRTNIHAVTRAMQNPAKSSAEATFSQSTITSDTESIMSTEAISSRGYLNSSSFADSSSATSFSSGTGATAPSSTRRQYIIRNGSVSPRDTPQSRYSNGTRSIPLPSPIDSTKQNGRMHIDWVRRDCGSAVMPVKTARGPKE